MATDSLPESSRRIIIQSGITIVPIEHLLLPESQHMGFNPVFARFGDCWTKLRVFGLVEYKRVVMIDSDMIFLRSMDDIFDMELPGRDWIGAAPACLCNPLRIDHYPKDW